MALDLVAICALGLEELLAGELEALGVSDVRRQRGAVTFRGGWRECWRANLRLRTANRVLVRLASWPGADGDALAAGAAALIRQENLRWDGVSVAQLFDPDRTFAIHATSTASAVRDIRWVGLKVKDGLVDAQRQRFGRRASIDREEPETPLRVWLHRDRATLLLDTSGEPLDRRGYRVQTTTAPVREQLAAALVLASGWDGRGPVVDPMCGSGTLLAEAAWAALGQPPGCLRRHWAFEQVPGFDRAGFEAVKRETLPAPGPDVRLYGSDLDPAAVRAARINLKRAGLADRSEVRRGDGFNWAPPPGPGLLITNPAYGERMGQAEDQWKRLGDLMKQRYTGWTAVVLAGDAGLGKHIGLKPRARIPVRNGPLDARILVFDLY
ncbi:MAG: RNA methyltransferase [Acidobacteria bacterium]|nr:RNA methyltransferase [Acidobacteriota bacterium]